MSTSTIQFVSLQIQRGKNVHTGADFGEIQLVLLCASLAFRDIAREQYYDGVNCRTGQLTEPVIWMVLTGGTQDLRSNSHALAELFGKGHERGFTNAESSQAVPGEGDSYPPGIWRLRSHRLSCANLIDHPREPSLSCRGLPKRQEFVSRRECRCSRQQEMLNVIEFLHVAGNPGRSHCM